MPRTIYFWPCGEAMLVATEKSHHLTEPPDTRRDAVPVTRQRVLPDPQDAPAGFPQSPIDGPVAPPVRRLFVPPERGVVCGGVVVLRTAMPEAAIDKHGHAEPREHKVRLAEHRPVASPATMCPGCVLP